MLGCENIEFMSLFIGIILYAEIHYRFPFFPFSRYHIREPEIISDAPYRLESGNSLPILILIKDAHRFPIRLHSIKIQIRSSNELSQELVFTKNINIDTRWWYEIIHVDVEQFSNHCTIHTTIVYEIKGKIKQCYTHNFKGLKKRPLKTYISQDPLPGKKFGWHWGDLHYHSNLTEDFAEFGAPLDATQEIAGVLGLSFVCITDHSYDLDDLQETWNKNDPDLKKWDDSRHIIERLNRDNSPLLIPSEEVTCKNSTGKNVHILVLNHLDFIPGSGDGAEIWFNTQTEMTVRQVVHHVGKNGLVIAAHPRAIFTFLGRLLLNRGIWEEEDFNVPGMSRFQILNGFFGKEFDEGLHYWKKLLLKGKKTFIYAGNDAHGNFNVYHQIKLPTVSLLENKDQIFGKCRTGVLMESTPTVESIISSLKRGKCVISDGPLLTIKASTNMSSCSYGESINGDTIGIKASSFSNTEFGQLIELALFWGDIQNGRELELKSFRFDKRTYEKTVNFNFNAGSAKGYIRGTLSTQSDDREFHFCYTNPIWIN